MVSILSILVDPFAQQVLSKVFKTVSSADKSQGATVPRIDRYDAVFDGGPTLAMSAAIMSGSLTPNIEPLAVTCATGNCAWPIQTSLAVCGACTAIEWDNPWSCTDPGVVYCS